MRIVEGVGYLTKPEHRELFRVCAISQGYKLVLPWENYEVLQNETFFIEDRYIYHRERSWYTNDCVVFDRSYIKDDLEA